MKLNQFLKVDKPPSAFLKSIEKQYYQFQTIIENETYLKLNNIPEDEDLMQLLNI